MVKKLHGLGYHMRNNILFQDNTSTITMAKNGRACLGKQNWAIDIRYFAIRDAIEVGDVEIKHISTDEMIADSFTKCLQGKKFFDFRKMILGM